MVRHELHRTLQSKRSTKSLHESEFALFSYSSMGLAPENLRCQIDAWLAEDAGSGDVTLFSILKKQATAPCDFFIVAKSEFVMCGRELMAEVFRRSCAGSSLLLFSDVADGDVVKPGAVVLAGNGPAGGILLGERVSLNLSCKLSGIATKTRHTLEALQRAAKSKQIPVLMETRKTTPGLRAFEKLATRIGGARNHRHGLDGGAMLKENHLRMLSFNSQTLMEAKTNVPLLTKLEVEVSNLEEFKRALDARVDVVMLDNFSIDDVGKAIALRNQGAPEVKLEFSGNLDKLPAEMLANCGVDYLSQGALIHQATWVDMSLQMFPSVP